MSEQKKERESSHDERERLYARAIKEREQLPIRGKWAYAVRKEKERKRKRKEETKRMGAVK